MKKFFLYHFPALLYAAVIIAISSLPNLTGRQFRLIAFDKIVHFIEYSVFAFLIFRSFSHLSDKISLNKSLMLSALAFAVSTLSTSATLPVIAGIFIYIVGHSVDYLRNLSEHAGSEFMSFVIRIFYLSLPNFSNFYLRNQLIQNDPYVPQGITKLFIYALIYAGFGLAVGYILFRKKDM